jgi:hypothetical protein
MELHANSIFLAPNHNARPTPRIAIYDQIEHVRHGVASIETGTRIGKIINNALG